MAACTRCSGAAVFSPPLLCERHFYSFFEGKVSAALQRFSLIRDVERVAVAVSGGKDSQTTLFLLHRLFGERVTGLAIDEGIPQYRDQTLADLRHFCAQHEIPFQILSFREAFGVELEGLLARGASACRSCGVLRRSLLNQGAAGFDKLATGHNLDDECQSILMNFLKGTLFLCAKLGPVSGVSPQEGFTQRVKPLFFCPEKEVAAYAFLRKFPVRFKECPHAEGSFRSRVRDALNLLEHEMPGSKLQIAERFLSFLPLLKEQFAGARAGRCMSCGSPAARERCKACETLLVVPDAA